MEHQSCRKPSNKLVAVRTIWSTRVTTSMTMIAVISKHYGEWKESRGFLCSSNCYFKWLQGNVACFYGCELLANPGIKQRGMMQLLIMWITFHSMMKRNLELCCKYIYWKLFKGGSLNLVKRYLKRYMIQVRKKHELNLLTLINYVSTL